MKLRIQMFLLTVVLLVMGCSVEKPWLGTYALEITEENKEAFEMFKEMNLLWPEITLNEDGTFLLQKTEGNIKIIGTYSVKGVSLTIKATNVNGAPPQDKYTQPHTVEFTDNYQILMIEGPDKERWVRKEINEAALK